MTKSDESIDLDICALEPIRIPGGIQPHGALLVLDPGDLRMVQASANLQYFTKLDFKSGAAEWLSTPAGAPLAAELRGWLGGDGSSFLRTIDMGNRLLQVSAHLSAQGLLIEFEAPPATESETLEALYPRLRSFVDSIGTVTDSRSLAELTVKEVRALTGFNRVMLYSFDAEGAGTVLAEDRDDILPSYLDLRFPASDIPPQARELYRLNRIRLIPNALYTPVPIQPATSPVDGHPLDLSLVALRSVSPVHLEYMRNMGTMTSLSISLLIDGMLWGLISCHNGAAKGLNAQVRTACDFLGQIVSLQIGARERGTRAARRMELKQIESELLVRLGQAQSFQDGLSENGDSWKRMVDSQGAALVTPEHLITVGQTPSRRELEELAAWLRGRGVTDVFATESLAADWPQGAAFAGTASGLLAISISQLYPSYIMWFREEVVRTVRWAGDPKKPATRTAERLHPRQSFELWKEQVSLRSIPWTEIEIESARDFRNAIVNFVLRRAEERAQLSEQLRATNQELEAFSYSISHDLRAPFRHIAGYAELLGDRLTDLDERSAHYLRSIIESALSAGQLVDDLLNFSQLGRTNLIRSKVDVEKMVREARLSVETDLAGRHVEWEIGPLPMAWADGAMLRQVFGNLIDNALKYSSGRERAVIKIDGEDLPTEVRYTITDNGVGFDMAYVGKLFGVFQRLHRADEFPGTGIGLALVKRIIDRHGGTVVAHGELNHGASVEFTLPKANEEATVGGPEADSSGRRQSEGS